MAGRRRGKRKSNGTNGVKVGPLSRLTYGLIGAGALYNLVGTFLPSNILTNALSMSGTSLLVLGGLSWGVVALTGKSSRDIVQGVLRLVNLK